MKETYLGKCLSTGSKFINFPRGISKSLDMFLIFISVVRDQLLVQSEREVREATKHHAVPRTIPHNKYLLDPAGQQYCLRTLLYILYESSQFF